MSNGKKTLLRAVLTLIGTVTGAGMFGIPGIFARTGLITGSIMFWVVALLVLSIHLLFVEVIARDKERRGLPGYVGRVLGPWGRVTAAVAHSGQLIGANLAYILLGGTFMAALVSNVGIHGFYIFGMDATMVFQIIFWLGGMLSVVFGLKFLVKVESFLTWLLIGTMVVTIIVGFGFTHGSMLLGMNWPEMTSGIGVFLFALMGYTVIPEIFEVTGRKIGMTRRVVSIGSLVSALLMWLFGVSYFVAITPYQGIGVASTMPAVLAWVYLWILPVVGFLAVVTSFITSAYDLHASYRIDFGVPAIPAWIVTLGTPLLLLFITRRDFLETMDIVGSFFTSMNGGLIAASAATVMATDKKPKPLWWRSFVPVCAGVLFFIAIIQRIIGHT